MHKRKRSKTGVSVINELAEIKYFIKWCKSKENCAGFNVNPGKQAGYSYIICKLTDSLQPKYVLPIKMDFCSVIERPLISNAIHEALYGESMSPEAMEDEMVRRSDPM